MEEQTRVGKNSIEKRHFKFTYDSPINNRPFYVKGIRELRGHIYTENFTPEIAAGRAVKIMYMAACLLSNTEYLRVNDCMEFLNMKVEQENLVSLRYLKKVDPEAYAYTIKADRLLSKVRR